MTRNCNSCDRLWQFFIAHQGFNNPVLKVLFTFFKQFITIPKWLSLTINQFMNNIFNQIAFVNHTSRQLRPFLRQMVWSLSLYLVKFNLFHNLIEQFFPIKCKIFQLLFLVYRQIVMTKTLIVVNLSRKDFAITNMLYGWKKIARKAATSVPRTEQIHCHA